MELTTSELELLKEYLFQNKYGKIAKANDKTIIVIASEPYIPIEDFKELFIKVGEMVDQFKFSKLIFDKRSLKVFHQPSMVWYFVEWKEEMCDKGLKSHRKILPRDPVFRECVKLGRENLSKENPNAKYHKMDIQYKNSIEEAIAS